MITSALIFLVLAVSSAVLGLYASPEQGLNQIMYWFAIVSLAIAAGFTLVYLARRFAGP